MEIPYTKTLVELRELKLEIIEVLLFPGTQN